MSKRPTIDSSLYTLEDRISVLIHCKLEKETENKIIAGRPNCLLQAAYTEKEKATVLNNKERNKDNLNILKFTRLTDDICCTEKTEQYASEAEVYVCVCLSYILYNVCTHTHCNTHTHTDTHSLTY